MATHRSVNGSGPGTMSSTTQQQQISAVPMLKVMRIQSPELAPTSTPSPTSPHLSSSLILPDSFGVIHIGETFTAYLGALNVSPTSQVTNLSVSAVLQTPTRRCSMPSALENKYPTTTQEKQAYKPLHVGPMDGVDAIVSRPLEETGQHILRVEVSYGGNDPSARSTSAQQSSQRMQNMNNPHIEGDIEINPRKMLRKFYRFHVSSPLHIRELTLRAGESTCIVSLAVENASNANTNNASATNGSGSKGGGLTISQNDFQPYSGLVAQRIQPSSTTPHKKKTAVELFDESGRLNPGESRRYMFEVKAASEQSNMRGIARGDELGKAVVTWHKAMGEAGRIASTFVYCPANAVEESLDGIANANKENVNMNMSMNTSIRSANSNIHNAQGTGDDRFVVNGSGLSVDVAASAADRSADHNNTNIEPLDDRFPVTVEPINPPKRMMVGEPANVQVLVVNHSTQTMNLQLQMRLPLMKGIVVYGQSFRNLGEIPPNGGSMVTDVQLIAMVPGLFFVGGCFMVDLNSGREIQQPHLLSIFVEQQGSTDGSRSIIDAYDNDDFGDDDLDGNDGITTVDLQ